MRLGTERQRVLSACHLGVLVAAVRPTSFWCVCSALTLVSLQLRGRRGQWLRREERRPGRRTNEGGKGTMSQRSSMHQRNPSTIRLRQCRIPFVTGYRQLEGA